MSRERDRAGDESDLYTVARRHYEAIGFTGWERLTELHAARLPAMPGVYVVLRPSAEPVSFLDVSSAGWHKGKDPTVEVGRLAAKWVPGTSVVYLGKATSLRDRLGAYQRQGVGSSAGHWGGRFIWQCADFTDFEVGWMTTIEDPADLEFDLIAEFRAQHDGRLPFGNLNQGRRRSV